MLTLHFRTEAPVRGLGYRFSIVLDPKIEFAHYKAHDAEASGAIMVTGIARKLISTDTEAFMRWLLYRMDSEQEAPARRQAAPWAHAYLCWPSDPGMQELLNVSLGFQGRAQ